MYDTEEDKKRFEQYIFTLKCICLHVKKFRKRHVEFLLLENQFSDWFTWEINSKYIIGNPLKFNEFDNMDWAYYKVCTINNFIFRNT